MSAHSFSRRSFLQAGAGVSAAMLLAACGEDGASLGSTAAGGSGGGAFPVTITHKFGSTVVKSEPKRIVSLGYTDHDTLLALGFVPVGVTQWIPEWKKGVATWAEDKLKGTTPALFTEPFKFEKVAELAPDLILNLWSSGEKSDYDKMAKIAPTIAPPAEYGAYGLPWDVGTVMIADSVGRKDEGTKLVEAMKAKITKVAADNPSFKGKTVSVITPYEGQVGTYLAEDTRLRLLSSLGFLIPDKVKALGTENFFTSVSQEKIDTVDADVIIAFGETGWKAADLTKALPGLSTLKAAKNDNVILISDLEPSMAFSASSILSLPLALDTIVPPLQQKTS